MYMVPLYQALGRIGAQQHTGKVGCALFLDKQRVAQDEAAIARQQLVDGCRAGGRNGPAVVGRGPRTSTK